MGFWDWWLGDTFADPALTRSEPPPEVPPIEDQIPHRSTLPMGEDRLLQTVNVYRAAQILSLGVAQLSIDVWRGDAPLPRPAIIRRPDVNQPLRPFLKLTVSSLALHGNAFWRIYRNDRNEATTVRVLSPSQCTLLPNGNLTIGSDTELRPDEFQHLGLLRLPAIDGKPRPALGPIQAARRELSGAVDVTEYGAGWFTSGDTPSGLLKTDQVLSPQQAADYKTAWQKRKAHEVAVLGSGLDYKPILLSPEDAQFLQVRNFDTTAIARLFGIPARLFLAAVEGGSMTYSNLAMDDLSFVKWSLSDYTSEIEGAFTELLPRGQTARFNLDALLRADISTRYRSYREGIAAGWLLRSECRAQEGLTPVAGIDAQPLPSAPASHDPQKEGDDAAA